MSRVEQVERRIIELSADESKSLRDWFAAYDADECDRQIEEDANDSRLARLAERALQDQKAGLSTDL